MDEVATSTSQDNTRHYKRRRDRMRKTPGARNGDIVTLDLDLNPEEGFVPEPLFDTNGRITFILGWGNYLPGLHEIVTGMEEGDKSEGEAIDAGWGERNSQLVIEVPKANFRKMNDFDAVKVGSVLNLKGGIQVSVIDITDEKVTVDANPPLAGSCYLCNLQVQNVSRFPASKLLYENNGDEDSDNDECNDDPSGESRYEIASWGMGCFWGGELAFMRTDGVVGTKVGYTQGHKKDPSYEEVSNGGTKHREAIMVVYDPEVVSYERLVSLFMERLDVTSSQYNKIDLFEEENDDSLQYKHGIYYHNDEQRRIAEQAITDNKNKFNVELMPATVFYDAEEYHQQYLLKGGQSARKNAKETIRCFG